MENPFIAKTKLKAIRKYLPVSMNSLGRSIPNNMLWDTELEYNPVFELAGNRMERFQKYSKKEQLEQELPGLPQLCRRRGARLRQKRRLRSYYEKKNGQDQIRTGIGDKNDIF